jgi:hypothetical protein
MVPVLYGASKLAAASRTAASKDLALALACIVLIPAPVISYWCYLLWHLRQAINSSLGGKHCHGNSLKSRARQASTTYPTCHFEAASENRPDQQLSQQQQRATATLALLGTVEDSPTLIFRNRQSGEQEFTHAFQPSDSSSSEDEQGGIQEIQGQPVMVQRGGTASGARPWRSQPGDFEGKPVMKQAVVHAFKALCCTWQQEVIACCIIQACSHVLK